MPDKYLLSSESLGKTVCGLGIPVVTFRGKEDETEKSAIKTSKYLVILARTHPGETSGSWVADGLLEWLAADSAEV
jgi:murein tripeptide amidase MpaA